MSNRPSERPLSCIGSCNHDRQGRFDRQSSRPTNVIDLEFSGGSSSTKKAVLPFAYAPVCRPPISRSQPSDNSGTRMFYQRNTIGGTLKFLMPHLSRRSRGAGALMTMNEVTLRLLDSSSNASRTDPTRTTRGCPKSARARFNSRTD